jgi:hypothetical protein
LENKKRGNHHWWPKGLQRFWVNSTGQIHLRKDGKVEPKNPNNNRTGCNRNAHYFDAGDSPWSHSFEDAFRLIDTKGADTVRHVIDCIQRLPIYRLSRSKLTSWLPVQAAATETNFDSISKDTMHCLARLAVSIVIRSPAFQFRNSFVHPAFAGDNLFEPYIGTFNIWQYWADFYRNPKLPVEPLSVVILVSRHGHEFVIGDGFYQTVINGPYVYKKSDEEWLPNCTGSILIPLSPDVCSLLLFNSNLGLKTALLSKAETDEINEITCLSSRQEIYFRDKDQPQFKPTSNSNIREVTLTEYSFLKRWIDTVNAI